MFQVPTTSVISSCSVFTKVSSKGQGHLWEVAAGAWLAWAGVALPQKNASKQVHELAQRALPWVPEGGSHWQGPEEPSCSPAREAVRGCGAAC